jgi:two-component sensor histidine kinase
MSGGQPVSDWAEPARSAMAETNDAERQLRRSRERFAALADFGRDALQHGELSSLLQRACAAVAKCIQVECSKVLRYRPETADLLVVAGVGWTEGVVGRAVLKTDVASPPGRALQTATSVAIEDLTTSDNYRYSELLRQHGVRSLINVPIIAEGLNWGVLEVDSVEVRRFPPEDEHFLMVFAHLLAASILRDKAAEKDRHRVEQAAASENRRELITRELHHRVRNNFQIIVSMLLSQSRKFADLAVKQAFRDTADRTIAIALAHEQLSLTHAAHSVDIERYLAALLGRIVPERPEISVELALQDFQVAVDQAVLVGLIVNEAITNALKHAFPEGSHGTVKVECAPVAGGTAACISVSDTGVGLLHPRPGQSGLTLIEALCNQLGGTLDIDSREGKGTSITVRFPLHR